MPNIILISTEHRESGNCNSDELCKIFESINPDVVFEEETDDEKYRSYYNDANSFKSLEVQAIIKYKQKHKISPVPVDAKPNQYLSFNEWDYLFNSFNRYAAYKQIVKDHCALRDKDGFAYLNSERCSELVVKMKNTERQIIEFSAGNRNELSRIYELFHKEHDHRENTMLLNIYNFTKVNRYNQAVFLLGFAHRNSVEQKISEFRTNENVKLSWTFYNDAY
jgi:hypothetical protein